MTTNGPLSGVRILDLSTMVAGPMAVQILTEQGASCVKVESPGAGADMLRFYGSSKGGMSAWFANTNRGKRGMVVDLDRPEGVDLVWKLIEQADVLVQNFRPGVVERLGIGADAALARNPSLVYVSVSGFGETGPYSNRRTYDPIIQCYSGMAAAQADPATGEATLIRSLLADKVTAQTVAQAITAALYARSNGAGGQHVRVNMLDAMTAWVWPDCYMHETLLDEDATRAANPMASYRLVKVADGYLSVGIGTDAQFQALWRAVGRPEVALDERVATVAKRMAIWGEVIATYEAELASWKLDDLLPRLEAEDVPHAPALSADEIVVDPQVCHNGSIFEVEHPIVGRMRRPRHPNRFGATPVDDHAVAPAPGKGEHTDEVLRALGFYADDIARLRADGTVA